MKKRISIIILTILFSNYCLASNIDTIRNDHSIFFEDSVEMSDLSKEKEVISRLMLVIAEFEKNDIKADYKKQLLDLNEKQALQLLKCMNVVADSKGKLLIVFVNKQNNKILFIDLAKMLNLNIPHIQLDNPQYQAIGVDQFTALLKEDKVEFKLKKVDGKFKSVASEKEKFLKDFYLGNIGDYSRISDMISNKYPVIFEESNMFISISWEKEIDSKTKVSSTPKVKFVDTMLGTTILGKYVHESDKSNYNNETKRIVVQTNGRYDVPINLCGHTVTLSSFVRSMTIIDDSTGENQFFAEIYRLL